MTSAITVISTRCSARWKIFKELITKAHENSINVMIDFVPNHTSDQHPWFVESRSSRTNDKRDYYVWRDGRTDGSPPNNWLSIFGGSSAGVG